MKIGNIVKPNVKGQIVIPQSVRMSLGITSHSLLQLTQTGNSLIIQPISGVFTTIDKESSYQDILRKTAGSWSGDSWPETRKKRRRIELKVTKRNKRQW